MTKWIELPVGWTSLDDMTQLEAGIAYVMYHGVGMDWNEICRWFDPDGGWVRHYRGRWTKADGTTVSGAYVFQDGSAYIETSQSNGYVCASVYSFVDAQLLPVYHGHKGMLPYGLSALLLRHFGGDIQCLCKTMNLNKEQVQ